MLVRQVSITLLVLSVEVWYPGIATLIISTSTLLVVCVLGTHVEVKCDQIIAALYDVPWYLMSVKHQKDFLFILLASQMKKPITFWEYAEVTVASFLDVNMFLCNLVIICKFVFFFLLQIYSKIYTGFMLLFNTSK